VSIATAAAAVLAACVRGTIAPLELYRLAPVPSVSAAVPGTDATDGSTAAPAGGPLVSVEPYTTPGIYGDPRIVYREGDTRYGTYPNREWAIPLGTMLATLTMETLRQQPGLAGRVLEADRAAAGRGLVWRGTVREFEEVDRDSRVSAAVLLDARLVRAADDSVLWSGSARAEGPVSRPRDMAAVVESLSSLTATVVATLARDARLALRASSPR
jgi:ABC-type uncharacterized transport system auxiliary subunit